MLEAIASRLEAIAFGLQAIAFRSEAIAFGKDFLKSGNGKHAHYFVKISFFRQKWSTLFGSKQKNGMRA